MKCCDKLPRELKRADGEVLWRDRSGVVLRPINTKKQVPFTLGNSRLQRTILTETSTARVDCSLELLNPSCHLLDSLARVSPVLADTCPLAEFMDPFSRNQATCLFFSGAKLLTSFLLTEVPPSDARCVRSASLLP